MLRIELTPRAASLEITLSDAPCSELLAPHIRTSVTPHGSLVIELQRRAASYWAKIWQRRGLNDGLRTLIAYEAQKARFGIVAALLPTTQPGYGTQRYINYITQGGQYPAQ